MGVVSRRVVPACGSLCCFCPSLRARSRQPVKRYKKLLSDIFPRNQEAEPNDRKIGKLCEYVSKNPLRIPKITDTLEQRFYKELRHENYGSVKVVLCIYRKLLSSCKEQMPLFSSSLLGIVRTLLEQTRQDELRILSCSTLVDFISAQKDSTYMFNLEGLIPKLCQLAEEEGDGERILLLRSSGLQVLASLVNFMGEHSHISMDFDNIISATLENYNDCQRSLENSGKNQWVKEVLKAEENSSSFPDMSKKVSLPNGNNAEVESSMDTSKSPAYWSRVCLRNMAALAKEATTVRRVLEPLFHNFDVNNYWSSEKGVAYPVLLFLQSLLEESGENSHLILSILAKHLDHRNVSKQPTKQLEIVNVITKLGQNAKQQASVAIIGSTSELMKHLRKCLQTSVELSTAENGANNTNADLLCALEKCISMLSNKVGDAGPLLDSMAVFLENITSTAIVARATVSSALRTAQIISSIPNTSYQKKTFPDALFHQLLVAMAHPDHETRIGAHSIFSVVLMPSLLLPWSDHNKGKGANPDYFGTVEKAKRESFAFQDESKDKQDVTNTRLSKEDGEISDVVAKQSTECDSHDHSNSFKCALSDVKTLSSLRLSSHQISLLLSSLWVQAASTDNMPVNFEAMGHSFNIALQFTRTKASGHMVLVRCFQLAFSLRSISLDHEGGLQPSRRRSLFTLASYMLVISARAGNLPELIPFVKASLTDETVDPYLELVEDTLQSAPASDNGKVTYGSEDDNDAASKSLSAVELNDNQLKEMLVSQFTMRFRKLSQDELHIIKKQLLEEFSPDDSYPLGAPFFMETPRPSSPLVQVEFQAFQEIFPAAVLTDDDTLTEINGSQSDRKTSLSVNTLDILGVDELMESVLETARQVASSQVSSKPVPYDQMKSQCEALVTGKQQKMSMLHSFKINQQEVNVFPSDKKATAVLEMIQKVDLSQDSFKPEADDKIHALDQLTVYSHGNAQSSFRLPPSSPYDKFLKAAGC